MFNDDSTHKERVQVLQSLMAKGAADVGRGVHSPREINQLLARTDAEFCTFQQARSCSLTPHKTSHTSTNNARWLAFGSFSGIGQHDSGCP